MLFQQLALGRANIEVSLHYINHKVNNYLYYAPILCGGFYNAICAWIKYRERSDTRALPSCVLDANNA